MSIQQQEVESEDQLFTDPPESLEQQERLQVAEIITTEELSNLRKETEQKTGLDLSNVDVTISRPGEELFDRVEIQQRLLIEKCGGDWDTFAEQYGFINQVEINELREAVAADGIELTGELPGFVGQSGEGEGRITFLLPPESHVTTLAEYYANQRGETPSFATTQEATEYLQGLAKEAYYHEVGHTYFQQLPKEQLEAWEEYIDRHPEIRERVIFFQQNKYGNADQVPVSEEAFCDFFVNVASNKDTVSRLGEDEEAEYLIEQLLPQQSIQTGAES